jgi:biotin carboxylase
MKRNWFAIAILSLSLSADALVLTSLLWVILKQGGTGQAVGIAAFLMALVPFLLQKASRRLNDFLAREPERVFTTVRTAGLISSLACAALPGHPPLATLYVIAGIFALLAFLTNQSFETLLSYRVLEKELSPNLASRILQTSFQIGAFLGGALSGFLIEWGGFRAVAVFLAVIYGFGALTVKTIRSLKDDPGMDRSHPAPSGNKLTSAAADAHSPQVWGGFLMIALVLVNVWAFNVIVPYLSGVERGWTARDYGLIDALAGAGAFIAALVLSGKLGRLWWLGFLGLAAGDVWLGLTPSVLSAATAAAIVGFFGNCIRVKQRELLFAATANPEQGNRWAANLSMIGFLTRALTPLALASVIDRTGGSVCFQILAIGLIAIGGTAQLIQFLSARFRPERRKPIVAIVDAYSSGSLIAPAFHALGYDCVHVMSSTGLAPFFYASLKDADFIDHILYQGNLDQTIEELKLHRPHFVIVGSEPGVELADALSERMGLRTNGTAMSAARRNKYLQNEAVRRHGLSCARHGIATSVEEGLSLAREIADWPIVVKPVSSSSTDMVHLCQNEEELQTALRASLGRKTLYGKFSDEVLIQSFLRGVEHVVDTLSVDGRHRVTGVWRYEKTQIEGSSFVYRQIELLQPESDVARTLSEYALKVLMALEIQHGPTHQEIMLSPEGLPSLVECNARLCGAGMPALWETSTGTSLPGLLAEAVVDPKTSLARGKTLCRIQKTARGVCLSAKVDYCILNPKGLEAIRGLESFVRMQLTRRPEDVYPRTVNLITNIGQIHLAHVDPAVVERDTQILRQMEASGLFIEVSAPRENDRPFSARRAQLVRVKAPVAGAPEAEKGT